VALLSSWSSPSKGKYIFCCRHCLHCDCYHSVTLKSGMHLTTYYLSLLQVQQVHAE
jgi:hypothetical protein